MLLTIKTGHHTKHLSVIRGKDTWHNHSHYNKNSNRLLALITCSATCSRSKNVCIHEMYFLCGWHDPSSMSRCIGFTGQRYNNNETLTLFSWKLYNIRNKEMDQWTQVDKFIDHAINFAEPKYYLAHKWPNGIDCGLLTCFCIIATFVVHRQQNMQQENSAPLKMMDNGPWG